MSTGSTAPPARSTWSADTGILGTDERRGPCRNRSKATRRLGEVRKETGDTPARPAATVVVLRDGPDGPETLMLRKNSKIAFGGMWVFPGGKVDAEDWEGAEDDVDAARTAAIREAEEEARLRIEAHEMVLFAHWIPPSIAPKRYATWFFAAPVDDDDVIIDDGEIVEMSWATPAAVLAKHHDGEIEIVPQPGSRSTPSPATTRSPRCSSFSTNAPPVTTPPKSRRARLPGRDVGGRRRLRHRRRHGRGPRHRLTMATDGYVYEDDGVPA